MASEFVSFMILFSIGMVFLVGINITITSIEDNLRDNIIDLQLESVCNKVKDNIVSGFEIYNWHFTNNDYFHYDSEIELPRLVGKRYSYEIIISTDVFGNYRILGKLTNSENILINMSIPLSSDSSDHSIKISGTFQSILPYHTLTFQKNGLNPIEIDLLSKSS